MKNNLEQAREIINDVDIKMMELFKKRMAATKMVADYKLEHNLPILDEKREAELKQKNLKALNDVSLEKYYLPFLEAMLSISKDYQKDLIKK